jgi:hypothetical protein
MRSQLLSVILLSVFCTAMFVLPSCKTIEQQRSAVALGAAAGGSIGALIGKKAGNPAIGATIGAALGGSTGAFITNRLLKSGPGNKPIYILNGTAYRQRAAREKLMKVEPQDIVSVNVLNGQEAIAMYGDKGENGAILINFRK